jgi:5-methylcytosine-specific restriction endonuclease McrA
MEDIIFIELCKNSKSMKEACDKIGMSFSTFKRKAKKLGCYKTNQYWSRGKTRLSDDRIKSKYKLEEIFIEDSRVMRAQIKNILIKEKLIEYVCSECGQNGNWNGKVLSLQIDHINGIRNDNRLSNLRFLCPNCHSQTSTFCNKIDSKSKKLEDFELNEIISLFEKSRSLTDLIIQLGIYDNTKNRNKLKIIKESYNLEHTSVVKR